jgi:hypothetical protein
MFTDRLMMNDLEVLNLMFRRYFESGKQGYAVEIVGLNNQKSIIEVNLTFLSGKECCCGEITCHFKPEFERIREIALCSGLVLESPLTIKFNVSVPSDAIFEITDGYNQKNVGLCNYQETFSE